jgi:hypothetical protein
MVKRILLILLIIFIAIQFFRPEKNTHAGVQPNDISTIYSVPANVDTILIHACKDCHSNNTRYPWYNQVQPVAWFLDNHVRDGRKSFNLNEFTSYPAWRQYDKISEVKKQIDKGDMPLSSYTWIHKDAILTDAQKNTIESWSEGIKKQMEAKYPQDSLQKPKRD